MKPDFQGCETNPFSMLAYKKYWLSISKKNFLLCQKYNLI